MRGDGECSSVLLRLRTGEVKMEKVHVFKQVTKSQEDQG